MREHELWNGNALCVREGDVVSHSGHVLRLRTLVQMCWGWPRKAAEMVVAWMREGEARTGHEVKVWIDTDRRRAQQRQALKEISGLADVLNDGLSGRITRESRSFNDMISGIDVEFDAPIADEGLTTAVLKQVSARLGCTMDELRSATHFTSAEGVREHTIYASRFKP